MTLSPMVWVVSWPLPAMTTTSPGAADRDRLIVEPDRARAITLALEAAAPGDLVLIAGKGHETGQQIGDTVVPFDDRDVARRELEKAVT